jgi:hypothetical protein
MSIINPYRFAAVAGGFSTSSIWDVIVDEGLSTNCQLALDFRGHDACWDGGQTITDLAGNSNWTLGATTGASTDDPSAVDAGEFNVGSYMLFDGGDFIRCTAADAWQNTLHKNNATFTFIVGEYIPSGHTGEGALFGTAAAQLNSSIGVFYRNSHPSAHYGEFAGYNGSANLGGNTSSIVMTDNTWNFQSMAMDEATGSGGIDWNINGTTATDTSGYSSPSASSADDPLTIGAMGNMSGNIMQDNVRIGFIAMWDSKLSAANLAALHDATDGVYSYAT